MVATAAITGFVDGTVSDSPVTMATAISITTGSTTATERMRVNSSGEVSIQSKLLVGGPNTAAGAFGVQVYGDATTAAPSVVQRGYSESTACPNYYFIKTRGTTATSTNTVVNGDLLGTVQFLGSDGTSNIGRAAITGLVDGAVSTGVLPTSLTFTTGTTVGTTRMTIGSSGKVDIYNAAKVIANSSPPAGGTTGLGLEFTNATNLGIFVGSGVPTLSAAQGSLYMRTDGSSTSTRMYINTNGSTTWTAVTTAA
jgi:hypothetical protein